METAGLWMLAAVAIVMAGTGLPAWISLTAVTLAFAALGVAVGAFDASILAALNGRIVGLLENDLLQALPLFVLMGMLIHRLPLAGTMFRVGARALGWTKRGTPLAALGLGVLLAPMSGSVGASVAMLTRIVQPRLEASRMSAERNVALICTSATLGVVIPPSLVLILLGDAMMRAHTEATHAAQLSARILNTQDVFHGALVPGALLVALCVAATLALRAPAEERGDAVTGREIATAAISALAIAALLGSVALGYLYAVEAAAAGGVALVAYGIATRSLDRAAIAEICSDCLAVTGALFALLLAATFFTLLQRAFGTDRWIASVLTGEGLGSGASLAAYLAMLATCALVLDAFEMIFVVVPLLAPAVLTRVPDAPWVAVLTLLILQASFLLPPFGYAVLMARSRSRQPMGTRALAMALLPYVAAQLVVVAAVIACPSLLWRESATVNAPAIDERQQGDMLEKQLEQGEEQK